MAGATSGTRVVAFWWGVAYGERRSTMHYEVDPSAVQGEAVAVAAAAEVARQVHLEGDLAALSRALPSGSTAAAVGAITSAWRVGLADVRLGVSSLAASLDTAAQGYERMEAMAAAALDAIA